MHYLKEYRRKLNIGLNVEFSLKEAAGQWWNEVYRPIGAALRQSGLMDAFPGHTADDLFLYILHHQLTKAALQGREVSPWEAVAAFREINPCEMETAIQKIFRGFVLHKPCARPCQSCVRSCPEGLICFNDGQIRIDETCAGCGECAQGCPNRNLTSYENVAPAALQQNGGV